MVRVREHVFAGLAEEASTVAVIGNHVWIYKHSIDGITLIYVIFLYYLLNVTN